MRMQSRCIVSLLLRARSSSSSSSSRTASLSCMHQQLLSRSSSLHSSCYAAQPHHQAWRGPCMVMAASRGLSSARCQQAVSTDVAEDEQPNQGAAAAGQQAAAPQMPPSRGPPHLPVKLRKARAHAPRNIRQRVVTKQEILQPQQQQQQPWQRPQQPQQPAQNALHVAVVGEVHRVMESEDTDYKVLYFKQVKSCSNGTLRQEGWQPVDVRAALAALNKSGKSNWSSSRSSSRSSNDSANKWSGASGDKWLTVTGNFRSVMEDMVYNITGEWFDHPKYGWQIKARPGGCVPVLDDVDPASFLMQVEGVGPATATRIVDALGPDMESIQEVLSQPHDQAVRALMGVPKVNRSIAVGLKQLWDEEMAWSIGRLAELQQKAGLTHRLASSITEHLQLLVAPGEEVLTRLAANPYELYRVIPGYTLQQADDTARMLGFNPCHAERGAAYLQAALLDALNTAKTSLPWSKLQENARQELLGAPWAGWDRGQAGIQGLLAAAELLVKNERVVVEEMLPLVPQQQQQQDHHHQQQQQQQRQDQQQQELFEFKVVQSQWSDDASVYLRELHKAEQDTVDYFVAVSRRCCETLQQLQQRSDSQQQEQEQQQQQIPVAAAGANQQQQQAPPVAAAAHTRAERRPSRRRRTEAAARAAEAASSIPSAASTIRLVDDSSSSTTTTTSTAASSSSSGVLQLPVKLDPAQLALVNELAAELSSELDKDVEFSEGQRVVLALSQWLPVLALTGGPGCGKTLVSQAVARSWLQYRLRSLRELEFAGKLYMAAPTGRAAQRLQELSGDDSSASTIHRLLGYRNPGLQALNDAATKAARESPELLQQQLSSARDLDLGSFTEYSRSNPLPRGKYLVDEVSMMDMALAAALFNALRESQSSLMLVGDPDQLPPVGPGQPVADALAEGLLPCIDLRQIYRTAANSAIVTSAHAINRGEQPQYSAVWDLRPGSIATDLSHHLNKAPTAQPVPDGGVLLLRLPNSCTDVHVAEAMREAMQQLVPQVSRSLKCDMQLDVQVLSPVKGGPMGVESLNNELQPLFNPPDGNKGQLLVSSFRARKHAWRVGDRVTHLKNDTQLDVYNGDQGFIDSVDPDTESLTVRYPPRPNSRNSDADNSRVESRRPFHRVSYNREERVEQLQLAWATTVHKAQGSEFPVVMLAMHQAAGRLRRRALLYTAVSRAQRVLIIVGTDSAITKALRETGLASAGSSRFRAKLRSARVAAGLPRIQRVVLGSGGDS